MRFLVNGGRDFVRMMNSRGMPWQFSRPFPLLGKLRAKAQFRDQLQDFDALFKRFLMASLDRKSLRVMFDVASEPSLGANWADVDLRVAERRWRDEGVVQLDFDDASFDVVLCTGLDRLVRPRGLAEEVRRVLRPGGQVWVQAPLTTPYHPTADQVFPEYWRITPDGLRGLFEGFDEVLSSVFWPSARSSRSSFSFFYGLRP